MKFLIAIIGKKRKAVGGVVTVVHAVGLVRIVDNAERLVIVISLSAEQVCGNTHVRSQLYGRHDLDVIFDIGGLIKLAKREQGRIFVSIALMDVPLIDLVLRGG